MSKLDDIRKQQKETTSPVDDAVDIKKHIDELMRQRQPTVVQPVKQPEPAQPQKPVEPKPELQFTSMKDRKKIIDKIKDKYEKKGIHLRRREDKMLYNMEHDTGKTTQGIVIGLAVVGIIFIMLIRNFLPNEAMYTLILIIGATMFMPIGMIAGWLVMDPVMRCKILRKFAHGRNYGLVGLVGKGNHIILKIKDFNNALIWKGNECWVLTKDKVMQITKDGEPVNDGKVIDASSMITLVETVPMTFVDLDSMEPLSFAKSGRIPVYPLEIGSALKAWVDNQRAKMMNTRKTLDIVMMIVMACCAGAIVVSVLTMQKVEEVSTSLETIKQQLANLIAQSQGF